MAVLTWDGAGTRHYETGVSQGVIYQIDSNGDYPLGVAWNGLISVTESPSGAEPKPIYADNIKYINMMSAEEFGATIEAYTYPVEMEACDGSATMTAGMAIGQQERKIFGMVYKTIIGNDADGDSHGYKLHLVYGLLAAPSEKNYQTVNDSPEAIAFSWEVSSTPASVTGYKPTSIITIDSTLVNATDLATLEDALFGEAAVDPYLPLPDAVYTIMTTTA